PGQMLTSNGTSSPASWQNAAFSNNVRFGVWFAKLSGNGYNLPISKVFYNQNTSAVSAILNRDSVRINQPGLYHFDLQLNTRIIASSPAHNPELYAVLKFTGGLDCDYIISDREPIPRTYTFLNNYILVKHISLSVYIPAATTLRFYVSNVTSPA